MPAAYQTVTQSASGTSDWIILNPTLNPFYLTLHAEVPSGTLTYTVEVTADAITGATDSTPAVWALTNMTDLTAGNAKAILGPITAARINITAYTSGSVILHARQTGSSR